MAEIHPTAIIDSRAQLHSSVKVGPYCILEGEISIGAGTKLMSHCVLKGPLQLGQDNTVYPFACLGMDPQDRKAGPDFVGPGTVIGDGNIFREHSSIHRGCKERATTIGHRNMFMANSHVAHDCIVGNDCTFANGAMLAGHVQVADRVIFGGGAGVQQFCRIGRMAFVSGVEGVTRDLPPFCVVHHTKMVSGLNMVGLRRSGLSEHIPAIKACFNILYRKGLTLPAATARIRAELAHDSLAMEFADFLAGSKIGVTGYGSSRAFRVRGVRPVAGNDPDGE